MAHKLTTRSLNGLRKTGRNLEPLNSWEKNLESIYKKCLWLLYLYFAYLQKEKMQRCISLRIDEKDFDGRSSVGKLSSQKRITTFKQSKKNNGERNEVS